METRISIDDGRKGMMRIADMLDRHGLTGVFYIAPFEPSNNMLTIGEIIDLSIRHEIGGHTLNHTRLTEVPLDRAKREIEVGKEELEEIIEKKITKFAYPRGWHNPEVMELVRQAGFLEGRTMKMGVIDRTGYDDFAIPVTAQNYPRPEYEGDTMKGIIDKFEEARAIDGYFNLVIHTEDCKRFGQWDWIESVFDHIEKRS